MMTPVNKFPLTSRRLLASIRSARLYDNATGVIEARINLVKLAAKAGMLFTVGSTIVQLLTVWGPATGRVLMDVDRHRRSWALILSWLERLWYGAP